MTTSGSTQHVPETVAWLEPLGKGLPVFGPPTFRLWAWALGGVAALALSALALWGVYGFLYPPVPLASVVQEHSSLRGAAMAWRVIYNQQRRFAVSAQIWTMATETDTGDVVETYLIVQPAAQAEAAQVPPASGERNLYDPAAAMWVPSMQRLSLSQQVVTLGQERLPRGSLITVLDFADEKRRGRVLFSSADSPPEGHLAGSVRLTDFSECLPVVEDEELRDGVLATPMSAKGDETWPDTVYWTAWRGRKLSVLRTKPCTGDEVLRPEDARFGEPPEGTVPLLTMNGQAAHILAIGAGTQPPSPILLEYPKNGDRLVTIGAIAPSPRGVLTASSSVSQVTDAFDPDIARAEGEPLVHVRGREQGRVKYLVQSSGEWGFFECWNPSIHNYLVKDISDVCRHAQGSHVRLGLDELQPCNVGESGDGERCKVTPQGLLLSYYIRDVSSGEACRMLVKNEPCRPADAADLRKNQKIQWVR